MNRNRGKFAGIVHRDASTSNRLITTTSLALSLAGCAMTSPQPVPAPESAPESAPALIPREAIFGNPERIQGRISPDGSRISWLAPKEGVMNVWVAPAGDLSAARAVTHDTYRGIRQYFWSPSSRFIYYLQDESGNENFHVYAAELATGAVTDLTPVKEGVRATVEGISRERPNEILVGLNDRNLQLFDLYRVQVESGERELVRENPGYIAWLVDNQLMPRFGIQQVAGGGVEVVDFDGKVLYEIPAEDFINSRPVGFNAANEILYAVTSKGRDTAALVAVDTTHGSSETLAANDTADIRDVMLHPTTYEPVAYSYEYLKTEWVGMAAVVQADMEWLRSELAGELALVSATDDFSRVVVHADAAEAPGVYYLFDRTAKRVTELFTTRPALAAAELQPMQALQITSRDGLELVSYLTLPPGADADGDGRPEAPQSMVLDVHGGPWARDSYGYNPWHQWLANRGHAVLSVNYRGSSGFGKKFTNAAIKEFAGRMHDDLIDGVRWAIDEKIAAADKIAIAGGSYGGYATLVGVTFTPDDFACGVDIVGPSSLATLIESFPAYWKPFLEGTWFKFVGDPANPEDRADMISRSPISRVDAIKVPLLVGQGQNDPRVTKKESDQLVEAMKKNGLPVTYVNFPDEGHGFARPENRLAFYAVMEGFLARCLGGRSAPLEAEAFGGSTVQVLEGADWVPGLAEALAAPRPDGGADSGN